MRRRFFSAVGGSFFRADDHVEGLGRREMVAYRTDAAQPLHHHRHFPVRPALDEFLEAAELDDMQPHLVNLVVVVQQQCDLAVSSTRDTGSMATRRRPCGLAAVSSSKLIAVLPTKVSRNA